METLTVPITSLVTFPGNARRGNVEQIKASLLRRGQYKPITVSSDGVILAGNHTFIAARDLGWASIAVNRLAVLADSAEAAEIVVVDNRLADLGDYDDPLLAALIAKIQDAENKAIGYTLTGIRELLERIPSNDPPTQLNDPDVTPTLDQTPAICADGDLWRLGPHLLWVGDCRKSTGWTAADVLVTDPPYGMDYQSNSRRRSKQYDKINGDETTEMRDAVLAIWAEHGNRPWCSFGTWKEQRPQGTGQVLIWDKTPGTGPGMGNLSKAFGSSHEEIYLSEKGWGKRKAGPMRAGSVLATTVSIGGPGLATKVGHPTPKPVSELMVPLLRVLSPGTSIADPFAGAGSTLIACHATGMFCRAVELEPRYADLICQRYADHTGVKPMRLEPCDATWGD